LLRTVSFDLPDKYEDKCTNRKKSPFPTEYLRKLEKEKQKN